jgi:hypothetical protein
MCHRASDATAWQCACGYEFGQHVETVRALLRTQHSGAWVTLLLLLVLDVAAVAGVIYTAFHGFIVFSALGFSALVLMTARTARKVLITRASLRQLAARQPPLPTAVVHKR